MSSAVDKFMDRVRYYYFHYTVITTVVMMEPLERYIFNSFFVVLFSLFLYATVIFLPGHLMMMLQFIVASTDTPADGVAEDAIQS